MTARLGGRFVRRALRSAKTIRRTAHYFRHGLLARPPAQDQVLVVWGFVAAGLWLGVSLASGRTLPLPPGLLIAAMFLLAAIAAIDARWGLVPDELLVGLAAIALVALVSGTGASLWGARLGGGATLLALGTATQFVAWRWFGRDALGSGDVKLVAVATLLVGLPGLATMLPLALASALVSVVLIRWAEGAWPDTLPFGPHLGLALLWTLLLGPEP